MIITTFKLAFAKEITNKTAILTRICTYCLVVFLYKQINPLVFKYIAATQCIVFCFASNAFEIAKDIKTGRIYSCLTLPVNYLVIKLTESIAVGCARFVVLRPLCFAITQTLINPLGIVLYNIIGLCIGLLAFWMHDIKQVFYVNLTMCFAFGGLIVPIAGLNFLPYGAILNPSLVTLAWVGVFAFLTKFLFNKWLLCNLIYLDYEKRST